MTDKISDRRLHEFIGLAQRAGKISSGEFAAEASVKSGKAKLCILADDASARTKKQFEDMCSYRNIRFEYIGILKDELGHVIGKDTRSVITVDDRGFAERISGLIGGGNACG